MKIKNTLSILFPSKKIFFLNLLGFLLLIFILFPYDDVVHKLTAKLSEASPKIHLQYDSHSLGFFPPRLIFKKAELLTPWTDSSAVFDRITITPAYLPLIIFKPGMNIIAQMEKTRLKVFFKTSFSSQRQKTPPIQIRAESKDFEIKHLHLLSPFFNGSEGFADFFIDLKMNRQTNSVKGSLQVRAKNAAFQSYSFSQSIGTWALPPLKWKSLESKAFLDKGRLNIQTMRIGEINDPLYLQSKGFVNLKFGALQMIREYNLELDLQLDEKMKNQFFFLDLFLSNVAEKAGKDRWQYKAKISGRSSYPPKIEKL